MSSVRLTRGLRWVAASATFFSACIDLLYGPSRLEYPAPFYLMHLSALVDSLILAATFYCAIGLIRGRRTAWVLSITVLSCAAVWLTVESAELISILSIAPLATIALLIATRHYYRIPVGRVLRSSNIFPALAIVLASSLLTVVLRIIIVAIERDQVNPIALGITTLAHMYDFSYVLRVTGGQRHLLNLILMGIGAANYSLLAYALLQPITDYYRKSPQAERYVLDLLEAYGNSSEDYFKYFPHDKSYFFSDKTEGFIAYAVENGVCVALADPIAPSDIDRQNLLAEFHQYCDKVGWTIVFLGATNSSQSLYQKEGFSFVKIGESAVINLNAPLASKVRKNLRNISNRFDAGGYHARFLHNLSPQIIRQLKTVSDGWGNQRGRREYRFAMGYFDESYIRNCRVFAVFDKHQQIMAFVNLQPNYSRSRRASIDMFRVSPQAPPNTMDFLLQSLFDRLRHEGWLEFDMGLAPLSGLDKSTDLGERGLNAIYNMANRWYSFKGIRRFKQKFNPTWEPMYVVYTGSAPALIRAAGAINQLLQYDTTKTSKTT